MKAVFVVGTGRSGTHFTARLLNGFVDAYDPLSGEEDPAILKDVARSAIHHRLPSPATAQYYQEHLEETPGIFLDQHHPNLFFVRHWAALFDGIVFLYPRRPTFQIVASMLRHEGVMRWYDYARRWQNRTIRRLPYPNQFLGLGRFRDINALPAHLLCTYRVIAHRRAYERFVGELDGALRSVNYEALVYHPFDEFNRVFTADEIGKLGTFNLAEQPKAGSLSKYRDVLSDQQVDEIDALEWQEGFDDLK